MKKELEIAVNTKEIILSKIKLELPEFPKYYSKNDDGRIFPRGLVLFAIIPKFPKNTNTYLLIEVERNKQSFNDFVPTSDCKDATWLKETGLRKIAFDLILKKDFEFEEITEDFFEFHRQKLLNVYKE